MNLLRLNVQPYFVYDGPARPWKRASRGGLRFHDEELRICKRMLSKLRVPYYQAPGEAEAECVLLEREGIVDAIWTDDNDPFMFGAQTVIRSHKEKKDGKGKAIKSTTHVAVYRAQTIKEKSFLDQQGFVLMAMISGGDYGARGLDRCGPNTALKLVKKGLGKSVCEARNDAELAEWRYTLQQTLKGAADVPLGFPCPKTLKKYMEPNVSRPEQVEEWKERFHKTYAKDVDENDLRLFLNKEIDIKTRDFLSHIVPWLLIRKLSMAERGNEAVNNIPSIQL
jgi:Holliday junction resolvase YEN1